MFNIHVPGGFATHSVAGSPLWVVNVQREQKQRLTHYLRSFSTASFIASRQYFV